MTRNRFLALIGFCLLSTWATVSVSAEEPVYELRVYTTNPGKLPDLLARFRDHTCRLFEKHGMENIGYWVPIDAENGAETTLIYILRHQSREAAKKSFAEFGKDPEWQAARQASEANGKILAKPPESTFMTLAGFSPPVKLGPGGQERVFEMRTYTTPEGKLEDLQNRFKNHTMALFTKHGMTQIAYWLPLDADKGAGTRLTYILAHPSKEAGLAAFSTFRADPEWVQAKADSEKNGPLTLPQPEGVKSVFMKAQEFSPLR